MTTTAPMDHDDAVRERYSAGATAKEPALCCPVSYDPTYLAAIPIEVIEKDYGCGDPSQYVAQGETVLDLGAGGGKACFIASQIVGPHGKVIGVDTNVEMLALARKYRASVAKHVGWENVVFRRGRIEDLALDLDLVGEWLQFHPVTSADHLAELDGEQHRLRTQQPMIVDGSIDVVISNCVLNLVRPDRKVTLFNELFRVVKPGGRVVISDIVADESVPKHMEEDPMLWSGCISGAMTELNFVRAFERAGFQGVQVLERSSEPWQTIEGIEFRSMTVRAFRGGRGACLDSNKAILYRGPWTEVHDDDGHVFLRGQRSAVCEKTFRQMMRPPYTGQFDAILPREAIDEADWAPFDCDRTTPRSARESKGADYDATQPGACTDGTCC